MTEATSTSVANHPEWPAPGPAVWGSMPSSTSAPAEHVRTHCPALIATLSAIAQAAKDDERVDDEPGSASEPGRLIAPTTDDLRRPVAPVASSRRSGELLGDPLPDSHDRARIAGRRANVPL
jgi:hypothetical protein